MRHGYMNFLWSETAIDTVRVNYKILGYHRIEQETIYAQPPYQQNFAQNDFMRQKPNYQSFGFITVDDTSRVISFGAGDITLDRNLIIPPGYTLSCGSGTSINMINSAGILTYSGLNFVGSTEKPIIINSTDSTGQGIVVLNAERQSVVRRVIFRNLTNPGQGLWQLTGALTFYESPVSIQHCRFLENHCEDYLNIIRSDFSVENSFFKGSYSDALDADFCRGNISACSFVDCGNDAIDVSGTDLKLRDIFVNNAGDKALSAGENSIISAEKVNIKNSEIGVAGKDLSQIDANGIQISNCKIGFTAYQKKPEFGPAVLRLTNLDSKQIDVLWLIEQNSRVTLNNKAIPANRENVKDILYGIEYGKSSRQSSL